MRSSIPWVLPILSLTACFGDLESITPYPCTTDGDLCPEGFVCIPGLATGTPNAAGQGSCVVETPCSTRSQNCSDSNLSKCGQVRVTTGVKSVCLPAHESRGQGEACTPSERGSATLPEFAYDECAVGFACSVADQKCKKYCGRESDCPDGHVCLSVGPRSSGKNEFGLCEPACILGAGAGADGCPSGMACDVGSAYIGTAPVCRAVGQVADGEACETREDCGAGSTCYEEKCRTLCNAENPCADLSLCATKSDSFPDGVGVCSCAPFSDDCGAGSTCVPDVGGVYRCRSVGEKTREQSCANTSECAADMSCRGSAEAERFYCRELCDEAHPCSAGNCNPLGSFEDGIGLCQCDILEPGTCPSGQACRVRGSRSAAVSSCGNVGTTPPNGSCGGGPLCLEGYSCWGRDPDFFCRMHCDPNAGSDPCADGLTCAEVPGSGGGMCLD